MLVARLGYVRRMVSEGFATMYAADAEALRIGSLACEHALAQPVSPHNPIPMAVPPNTSPLLPRVSLQIKKIVISS